MTTVDEEILKSVRKNKQDENLATSHAAVLQFNAAKTSWDSMHAGIATVFILVNHKNNAVRICAATDDKQVVLDSPLTADLLYQKPSESFVQWKAGNEIHGLNFASIDECDMFDKTTNQLVRLLAEGSPLPHAEKDDEGATDEANKSRRRRDKPTSDDTPPETPLTPVIGAADETLRKRKKKKESAGSGVSTGGGDDDEDPEPAPVNATGKLKKKDSSAPPALPPDADVAQNKHLARVAMPAKKGGSLPLPTRGASESSDATDSGDETGTPRSGVNLANAAGDLSLRDQLVRELFTSECKYVEGLMMLQHQYVNEGKTVFTEEESRVVFGNVPLLTNYNKALLKDMRARVTAWSDSQRIGDIFERMIPFLKMYEQYCSNHPASIKALIELKKRKDVQKFLTAGEATVKHSIDSLLITPVQRLPRYVLFMKDLVKSTPETHVDYTSLRMVLDKIETVAAQVNRGIRQSEAQKKKFAGLQALVAPHREFVAYSDVIGKEQELKIHVSDMLLITNVLLFTDLLVFATPTELVDRVPLTNLWCEEATAVAPKFLLVTPDKHRRFIVDASSMAAKEKWISLIRQTIEEWLTTSKTKVNVDGEHRDRYLEYQWAKGDVHKGLFRLGRMHGEGRFVSARGDQFVGAWKDNKMDGPFSCVMSIQFASGAVYEGNMLNDLPHGTGKLTGASKLSKYDGEWVKGAKEGEGTMEWGEARRYVGTWKANQMHGIGTLTIGEAVFAGEWVRDVKHGQGSLLLPGGVRYDGQWENDARSGQGCFEDVSGVTYVGTWKDNKRHGTGVEFMPRTTSSTSSKDGKADGKHRRRRRDTDNKAAGGTTGDASKIKEFVWKYEGYWMNDAREGTGTLVVPATADSDELRYEGSWHGGRRHGAGRQSSAEGEYDGQWLADERSGRGVMMYADGSKYDGEWLNDKRHGTGVWRDAAGNVYDGAWRQGKRSGVGTFTSADARYAYEGDWLDDRRTGRGKESDASGATFVGAFVSNQRKGAGMLMYARRRVECDWSDGRPVVQATETLAVKSDSPDAPPTQTLTFNEAGTQINPMEPSLPVAAPVLFV